MTNFWVGFEKQASSVGKTLERLVHGLATRSGRADVADRLAELMAKAYKSKHGDFAQSWKMTPELLEEVQTLNVMSKENPSIAKKLLFEMAESLTRVGNGK